ncbi:MAG: rRNA maturation RNase YbeY [Bacteroidales bacterium]|nr:rRNA maturation RNase YbeY [Bacteroidales bacterium]
MSVRFAAQSGDFEVPEAQKVKKWVAEVVKRRDRQVGNINYLFCDDEYLLQVNRQYLQHDTYTDIITFDYVAGGLISGDIMISTERVGENAAKYGVPFERELHRVVIHGVLHLLGQGDKSDDEAREMRRQEDEALALWDALFHEERKS